MTESLDLKIRAGNSGLVTNDLGLVVNLIVGTEPLDLTGQEVVFRVLQGSTQVLRKTTTGGAITLTNGTDLDGAASAVPNRITVPISVTESRTLEAAGAGLTYDLERRPAGGSQRTIIAGNIFVEPGSNDD
jgi:hypothetical protein